MSGSEYLLGICRYYNEAAGLIERFVGDHGTYKHDPKWKTLKYFQPICHHRLQRHYSALREVVSLRHGLLLRCGTAGIAGHYS